MVCIYHRILGLRLYADTHLGSTSTSTPRNPNGINQPKPSIPRPPKAHLQDHPQDILVALPLHLTTSNTTPMNLVTQTQNPMPNSRDDCRLRKMNVLGAPRAHETQCKITPVRLCHHKPAAAITKAKNCLLGNRRGDYFLSC